MMALTTRGLMANHEKEWELLESEDHGAALKPADRAVLRMVLEAYGTQGRDALGRETYIRYPYTAIRSKMAERLLDTAQLAAVANALPPAGTEGLYTIGYEGLDLDEQVAARTHCRTVRCAAQCLQHEIRLQQAPVAERLLGRGYPLRAPTRCRHCQRRTAGAYAALTCPPP